MAKKPAPKKKKAGRRFDGGGLAVADILQGALGSGSAGSVPATTALADPAANAVARRGANAIARPGRPVIDVDLRGQGRAGPQFAGSGQSDAAAGRNLLSGPKAGAPAANPAGASRLGMLGRGLAGTAGLGALALMPDTRREAADADKPRNYPGEGLQPKTQTPMQTSPADFGPPRPLNRTIGNPPAAKAAAKPAAPKKATPATSDDDAFMNDLRASVAKMKSDTAEAARATGRMKEAAGRFANSFDSAGMKKGGKAKVKAKPKAQTQAFAKGGTVKSRGDGIAQRGRTKGRIV